jgi:hypothetical protein
VAVIDAAGETPRPEMAEYRSENGFVVLDAAIMLLSADLAPARNAGNDGTFCRAKRSSSVDVPCDARLCLVACLVVVGVVGAAAVAE